MGASGPMKTLNSYVCVCVCILHIHMCFSKKINHFYLNCKRIDDLKKCLKPKELAVILAPVVSS